MALLGCRADGLAFRADVPVSITFPAQRERVTLPVTVELRTTQSIVRRQAQAPDRALFVVFVDQEPMPVGETIAWVARDDDGCRKTATCPDIGYLNDRAIYLTSSTRVTLETVLTSPRGRQLSEGLHRMVVVLLDDQGRRQGEPSASRDFFVNGQST